MKSKVGKPSMVFIAHYVENWNWLLKFRFAGELHSKPENAWHWLWLWPIYSLMSLIYLFRNKKPFEIVDDFDFASGKIKGQTILLRNFGWHFFLPNQREQIRKRIAEAVIFAQDHVSVIGLGALTKDVRITDGGQWLVKFLDGRLRVPIIHGDTLTAAAVIHQALSLIDQFKIGGHIFLTGSTSKIGRAVALGLASRGINVLMYTQDQERFDKIREEAGESGCHLTRACCIGEGHNCSLWITGKSIPSGKELQRYLPHGAIVLNFAVPNPLKACDLKNRKDIKSFEGGLLAYDPKTTDLHFTMRLRPGITYACHAGTFVHAYKGWMHNEVGPVDMTKLDEVWEAALEVGFFLPEL